MGGQSLFLGLEIISGQISSPKGLKCGTCVDAQRGQKLLPHWSLGKGLTHPTLHLSLCFR